MNDSINNVAAGVMNAPAARPQNIFTKISDKFANNQRLSATTRQAFLFIAASITVLGLIAICVSPFIFSFSYEFYIAIFIAFISGLIFGMFFAMVFVTGIIVEQFETIKGKMGIYIVPVTTPKTSSNEAFDFEQTIDKSKLN